MDGFLHGRQQISGDNIKIVSGRPLGPSSAPSSPFSRAPGSSSAAGGASQSGEKGHQSTVETVVEDGRVVRIIVTCSCGEVTEIDCDYSGDE